MTKNVREQARTPKPALAERPLIPPKYQHIAAIACIFVSLLIFFHALVFDDKTYQSVDSIAAHSWDTFRKDSDANGIIPLWNPYIFGGMPGFASMTYPISRIYDISTFIWESGVRPTISFLFLNERSSGSWLIYYLVFGIGVYLFVYQLLKNKMVALIVAFMAIYATYVTLLIMMWHVTKLAVLAWFPFVFLIVDRLRYKFELSLAIILPIIIRLLIEPGHVQFIFYIYLSLGIYFIFFFIRALIKKESLRGVIISCAILVLATGLAFLMGADLHLSTLEYNAFSTRGANPIQNKTPDIQGKTVAGGLDYDYATSWSFSPGEVTTFFFPSWYGFGPLQYQGPLSQNQIERFNFYLGRQPLVDGPQYMGVVVVILAMIGFYRFRKDPIVQYMTIMILLALFISFGKEFSLVYDFMYRYFPMFNKFRVPVIILMLAQFFTPILAGFGIASFLPMNKKGIDPKKEKVWKYTLIGLVGGLVFTLVFKDAIKDIYSSFFPLQEVGNALAHTYGQLNPAIIGMFFDFIFSEVHTDIIVFFIYMIILFGSVWYYKKGKIKESSLYGVILLLVIVDLWRVDGKTSEPKSKQETNQYFATPAYVKLLQQDTTQFRILKLIPPMYDNTFAYWGLYSAYGYHGAKMRIFQDLDDVAGMGNPLVWQLMNIKYLITNKEEPSAMLAEVYKNGEMRVYAFRNWLPHVFFVNKCEMADGLGILNKIASLSFDPRNVAYVTEDPKINIDPPKEGAQATIAKYGTQDLEVRVVATGNNLLFLSDVYYPKGWKAYIDDKETNILRLNYLFRGVIIPQGNHTLVMKYEPTSFSIGKTISLITNLVIYCVIILLLLRRFLFKREKVAITK
jgi:hypothetical protein